MNQTELNNFAREHFDTYKKRQEGHIVHDPGTTLAHRTLVEKICEWAHIKGYLFFTRVYLKNGHIADICIPELKQPFIEVRSSEEKKEKEYLAEYRVRVQFVDVSDPFKLL